MRRVLLAVCALTAIGSYAEAGLDSAAPENPVLTSIQSFIAQQRRADAEACTALGKADVEACVRERARERRAQLEGPTAIEPAGTEI
jgi:hypothetical protein